MRGSWMALGLVVALASCGRAPETLSVAPVKSVPAPQAPQAMALAPERLETHAEPDALAPFRRIAARGGLIAPFGEEVMAAEAGYQVQLVPETTEARALAIAREWAPDAKQLFVGWGYWKKSWVGFVRHGFYSAKRDEAYMVDFILSRWVKRKQVEAGENYREAASTLNDVRDEHRFTAKMAMDVAKREGYAPKKLHVAALVDMGLYGPYWIFVNDEDWSPELLVHAKTGQVAKTGPMVEAAKLLMGSYRNDPSPKPTEAPPESPEPSPSSGGMLPGL